MKSKKAQSSTEFVILVTFMLFVFLIFLMLIQNKMSESVAEKNAIQAQDIMDRAVNEIRLAESVSDYYYRDFTIPNSPNGFAYNISILVDSSGNAEMIVTYDNKELIYFLDTQISNSSTIKKGVNTIKKENGTIEIN